MNVNINTEIVLLLFSTLALGEEVVKGTHPPETAIHKEETVIQSLGVLLSQR